MESIVDPTVEQAAVLDQARVTPVLSGIQQAGRVVTVAIATHFLAPSSP
jgi:hypothetical protein